MAQGGYVVTQPGGAERLEWVASAVGQPGPGQIRLRHDAIGVNYIDIYHRMGLYPLPLPTGIGVEGAGFVEAVGSDVTHLSIGDRVVYAGGQPGAYANVRLIQADRAVRLPEEITSQTAAALFFKGLTAQYLIKSAYQVKAGEWVLLHAAAGGVGIVALQWLKHIGANVIGIVSTEEKAELARAYGASHVIIDKEGNFSGKVREIVPQGVDVVYDSVGKATFTASLDSLRIRGMMVSFGMSSGKIPPIDLSILGAKGSLYFTRCTIAHYMASRTQLEAGAADLFSMIAGGIIKSGPVTNYALKDAPQAHRDLESRRTSGSLLLIP
ncbi:quinone oxidoreductase [Acidocella aquatica]|uniref:Quinone oxidoreductase n=1 Tax=Acidocella aquatica TaxID=1922313 RepID=A0ABQ6AD83_9PROT|nr:quinone oxidoreductase [Acidocella aquatica]GLR68602.1 quinone oxidoreductase [Acidocella aquatica]